MYGPGMGQAMSHWKFWVKERPHEKGSFTLILEAADLSLADHYTGPVNKISSEMGERLESLKSSKKSLEYRLAALKEELRQTDVTIAAFEAAEGILQRDISRSEVQAGL